MKSFEPGYLDRLRLPSRFIPMIRLLGESKGRQDLYREQSPQVLESLRQVAIIQSTESSNRIEGVTAPLERIRDLVAEKTTPRNRPEQEIAGYRDVLNLIHSEHRELELSLENILMLYRRLYHHLPGTGGGWKQKDNTILERYPNGTQRVRFEPVPARGTPAAMKRLVEGLNSSWDSPEAEPLILIAAGTLDFLCIHPFADGNGRMARLLTLLLLYKAGYEVGRYISLEKIVEDTRVSYYDCLYRSSQGWHQGRHDLLPWLDYFIGVLLTRAYHDFEHRVGLVTTSRGSKTALVRDAIDSMTGEFSVRDVEARCPNVSLDLIRRILHLQRQAGKLECLSRGPDAHWRRK